MKGLNGPWPRMKTTLIHCISGCLLLLCLGHAICPAQSVIYKRYTSKDGLPNSRIYRVCQDDKGYLWISTNQGISSFDGYGFTNYLPQQFGGTVFAVAAAHSGKVWVAKAIRPELHCVFHGTIKDFHPASGNLPDNIVDLKVDNSDRLWLLTADHKCGYIQDDKYFPLVFYSPKKELPGVNTIFGLKDKSVLLATSAGMYQMDAAGRVQLFSAALPESPFISVTQDEAGTLYFGSTGKIYTISHGRVDSMVTIPKEEVLSIAVDRRRDIWLVMNHRPGLYRIKDGILSDFSARADLQKVMINALYCDKQGNLFAGSYGKGLYLFSHTNLSVFDEQSGLSSNNIYSITGKDEKVFAGGFNGITIYDGSAFHPLAGIPLKSDEKINAMLFADDCLWVGSPLCLYKYNVKTGRLWTAKDSGIISLCTDGKGHIMAGGYDRVLRYPVSSDLSGAMPFAFPNLRDRRINGIVVSLRSGYWLATNHGIVHYRKGVREDFYNKLSPPRSYISAVLEDSACNLWFATQDGIWRLDTAGKWHSLTTRDGLSDNFCRSICMADGKLYIGTVRGLNMFDGFTIRKYGNDYGLPQEEINALYEDKAHHLWIGTEMGLYKWDLAGESDRRELPIVNVTSIQEGDRPVLSTDTIVLPYRNHSLSVDFTAIDYAGQESIVYEYRLLGTSEKWTKTGNHVLLFSSLKPGSYTLQLRAKYAGSNKTSPVTELSFRVAAPFWQQWWFIVLVILISSCGVALGIRLRIRAIRRKEKLQAQRYMRLLRLKQQATNALIGPHFIFNALNSIQHFINRSDMLSANRYLTRFAKLIRATMENATRLHIRLRDEIGILELYLSLEATRLNQKLTYELILDETLDQDHILIPSMLIQPYVENAVWHGITPKEGAGHIRVSIRRGDPPFILISIEDDGVGIDTSKQKEKVNGSRQSRGMSINQQRLEIIEKLTGHAVEIEIQSASVQGTVVKLKIPYQFSRKVKGEVMV